MTEMMMIEAEAKVGANTGKHATEQPPYFSGARPRASICGRNWYHSAPEYADQQMAVGIRAHTVVVYGENGEPLSVHPRSFSENRTDTADYATSLQTLLRRPRACTNSPFRTGLSEPLRENLDQ